jgi:hypothetical protein
MLAKLRYMPLFAAGLMLLAAGVGLAVGMPLGGVIAYGAVAGLGIGAFALTRHRVRKALGRGAATIQALSKSAFDGPALIERKFESSLTGTASFVAPGGKLSPLDGFTASGTFGGVAMKIATGTSASARQKFELEHTYSYVMVDPENAAGRFRFLGRDAAFKVGQLLSDTPDHGTGDPAFDREWVVSGDPDIARAVMDDALRAELTALQVRAHGVSAVGMSVELNALGLVVRWPDELDEQLALQLRDLALKIRGRLLGHLRSEKLIDESSDRVRVSLPTADAEAAAEVDAVLAETPAEAARRKV